MDFDPDTSDFTNTSDTTPSTIPNTLTNVLESKENSDSDLSDSELEDFVFDEFKPNPPKLPNITPEANSDPDNAMNNNASVTNVDAQPFSLPSDIDELIPNFNLLDRIQIESFLSTSLTDELFLNPTSLRQLISSYCMPVKAFDSEKKLYTCYSNECVSVLESSILGPDPDLMLQEKVSPVAFLHHYLPVPVYSEVISYDSFLKYTNQQLTDSSVSIEIIFKTSYPGVMIPVKFIPTHIDTLSDPAQMNVGIREPTPTLDLLNSGSLTVDTSTLCVQIDCSREILNNLASVASTINITNFKVLDVDLNKISSSWSSHVETNQDFQTTFSISTNSKHKFTKRVLPYIPFITSYDLGPSTKLAGMVLEFADYAMTIYKEFNEYNVWEHNWIFHSFYYAKLAKYFTTYTNYKCYFINPFLDKRRYNFDTMLLFPNISSYIQSKLVLDIDIYITSTTSNDKYDFLNSLNLKDARLTIPQRLIPNQGTKVPGTTISSSGPNASIDQFDLNDSKPRPNPSQPLGSLLSNGTQIPNQPGGANKPGISVISDTPSNVIIPTQVNPVNNTLNSGSSVNSNSSSSNDPTGSDIFGEDNDNLASYTATINDPRLFYSVAGFPVLDSSVIQTISPTDLANLSLGSQPLPSNLKDLPFQSYTPLLPFKSHKILKPKQDDVLDNLITLLSFCDMSNDLDGYDYIPIVNTKSNSSVKSYGNLYIPTRTQVFDLKSAILRQLRNYNTDPFFSLRNLLTNIKSTNLSNNILDFTVREFDPATKQLKFSSISIDSSTPFLNTIDHIITILPKSEVDLKSFLCQVNSKIAPNGCCIPYDECIMKIDFNQNFPDPLDYIRSLIASNSSLNSRFDVDLILHILAFDHFFSSRVIDRRTYLDNIINTIYIDTICRSSTPSLSLDETATLHYFSFLNKPSIVTCLCAVLIFGNF